MEGVNEEDDTYKSRLLGLNFWNLNEMKVIADRKSVV